MVHRVGGVPRMVDRKRFLQEIAMKLMKVLAAMVLVGAAGLAARAENYAVDPVHSSTAFRIKHLNTAYFYGRFNAPEGSVSYDAAKPEATAFNVTINVDKVDTGNANRDNHLKSPTFFNAKEYPT